MTKHMQSAVEDELLTFFYASVSPNIVMSTLFNTLFIPVLLKGVVTSSQFLLAV